MPDEPSDVAPEPEPAPQPEAQPEPEPAPEPDPQIAPPMLADSLPEHRMPARSILDFTDNWDDQSDEISRPIKAPPEDAPTDKHPPPAPHANLLTETTGPTESIQRADSSPPDLALPPVAEVPPWQDQLVKILGGSTGLALILVMWAVTAGVGFWVGVMLGP